MMVLNDPETATNNSTPTMPSVMSDEVRSVRREKRARLRTAIFRMLSMEHLRLFRGFVRRLADPAVFERENDLGLAHDLGIVSREHECRPQLIAHFFHQFDDAVRG